MKRYTGIILIAILVTGVIISCNKGKEKEPTPKDYIALIKTKIWWGAFACSGELAQYYSVYFKEDGSLEWNQLSGQIPGKWAVNGKQLTMTFSSVNTIIKADIDDNNVLMNIVSTGVGSCTVTSGELLKNPELPLENTFWKGIRRNGASGPTAALEFRFLPGVKVEIKIGNVTYGPYAYKRSPISGAFRVEAAGNSFFGVITSDTEMKGSNQYSNYQWQVTRQ